MTKVEYIVVSFIVYTSGDMRNNLQNARKQWFSFTVVNKNLEKKSQGYTLLNIYIKHII